MLSLAVSLAGSFLSSKPFEVVGSAARFVPTSPVGPDRQKERRGECYREYEGVRDDISKRSSPLLGVIGYVHSPVLLIEAGEGGGTLVGYKDHPE
jgi:hypothetical protein